MTELPPSSDGAASARIRAARETFEHADQHPDFEVLAALVDGTLVRGAAANVQRHVETCGTCAQDLSDLRLLRAQMSYGVEETSVSTPTKTAAVLRRAPLFWRAAAAAVAATVAGTVWVSLRHNQPPATVATLAPPLSTPSTSPPPSSSSSSSMPEIAGLLDGGRRISLKSDGTVDGLTSLPAGDLAVMAAVLRSGRFPDAASLRDLRVPSGALMGSPSGVPAFAVSSPVGTGVESDRPPFVWTTLAGARSYRVSVFDTALNKVAASDAVFGTHWTPSFALPRGLVLIWQVEAETPAGAVIAPHPGVPEARFRLLSAIELSELGALRDRAAGSHFALAVIYCRYGIIDRAVLEAEAIARENPGSTLAAGLAAQLRALPR